MSAELKFKQITSILQVREIETALPFWTKLGFVVVDQVMEEEKLGFVILKADEVSFMMQTEASVEKDGAMGKNPPKNLISFLYLNINNLDVLEKILTAEEIVVPRRKTFYGAEEIWAKDHYGNIIGFAEFH